MDLPALGAGAREFCELGMRRMLAFRDAGQEPWFFDIHFEPYQRDPFLSLERLYAFLGETLMPATRERMAAWRRQMPRENQLYARTTPAAFGLDAKALRCQFHFYADRFGIGAS